MRHALLLLGAALAAFAVQAQDALSSDLVSRLRQRYPGLDIRAEGTETVTVREGGKEVAILDLGNLRAICAQDAQACEEQKRRRVEMVGQMRDKQMPGFSLASVRAVVRPAGYVEAVRRQFDEMKRGKPADEARKIDEAMPISRPLGRGFVRMWVQDSPGGMSPLSQRDLDREKLSLQALDRASTANLQQEEVPPLEATRLHPSVWVSGGNDYVSTVWLDEPLWRRVADKLAGEDAVTCVPERHVLIAYFPRLDPRKEIDPARLCRQAADRAPVAFSDQPVPRINDNWQIK